MKSVIITVLLISEQVDFLPKTFFYSKNGLFQNYCLLKS